MFNWLNISDLSKNTSARAKFNVWKTANMFVPAESCGKSWILENMGLRLWLELEPEPSP